MGQASGAVAFTPSSFPVTLWDFNFLPPTTPSTIFNLAQIDAGPAPFTTQSLRLNNINIEFDFSGLGYPTSQVTLDFLDMGGFENLSVDGSPVIAGEIKAAPSSIGSVSVGVTTSPVASGSTGVLTLKGAVTKLRIGGQEFWIDNVCAYK